ncbi:MAG: PAS domain S-box protein [Desulfamplus sp.]
MKVKYTINALMLILVIALSGIHFYQTYTKQKNLLIQGIDKKLYTAAMMARAILPMDYHANIIDSSSISKEEFDKIVTKYNQLCVDLDLEYLWSVLKINGKIVFTTSTSPDKNTDNQKHAKFFETHSNPESYEAPLLKQQPEYKEILDEWGKLRVVLIPFQDSTQRPYLFGACIKLSEMNSLLTQNIKETIYLGVGSLIAGFILSYFLSKILSVPLNNLASETSRVASGQLNEKIPEKGFYEQVVLARNFNQMTSAINQKIAKLIESEEKFSKAFQSAPILMSITDVEDGRFIDVNDAFVVCTGFSREKLIGSTSIEIGFVTTEDRDSMIEILNNQDQVRELELNLHRADGTRMTSLYSAEVIEIDGKKKLLSTAVDITDRKQSEIERERLIRAIEQVGESIVVTDTDGSIQYINPSFEKITGYSYDEVMGQNPKILKSGKQDEDFYKKLWTTISQGQTWSGQMVNKKKDGNLYTEEASISPIMDSKGIIINYVAVKKDITEELNIEAQIKEAQKMESIGSLAGGIAHDFNNILFPIIGMSELVMEDLPKDSQNYENVREIFKAGKRGQDLVSQILSFSRKSEQTKMPVKFQKVLKEVLKLCRSTIPTNIEIEKEIQQDCGSIWANATQLHQIAMNLITNAYHAVQDKNGKIRVEFREIILEKNDLTNLSLSSGKYALLSISDNGIGISDTIRDKIFDPYFTTKEKGKGTGLGLSVVYGIVKEFGGDIKVDSTIGIGTAFNVYLPLIKKSADIPLDSKKVVIQTGNEHILLVDDEPSIARLVCQMFERLGYEVTTRVSSIEALEAFKENPHKFDIVVSDMSMPAMTGDQLAYEVKKIRPKIPFIICTGFSERINKENADAIGVDGFLMKPIIKSDMAQMIRKVLDKTKNS